MSDSQILAKTLLPVLTALAASVLAAGVGSAEFSRISRRAFVLAAAQRGRFRNGKINYSLVAAATGLSRAEVRRILTDSSTGNEAQQNSRRNTTRRLMIAWRTDPLFIDRGGQPRTLTLSGEGRSFRVLAEKYCHGISPVVILRELQRCGAVSVRGNIVSLREIEGDSATLQRLTKFGPVIAELCYAAAKGNDSALPPAIEVTYLPVRDAVDATLVRKHATAALSATTQSLRAISHAKTKPGKSSRLMVATILANTRPTPAERQSAAADQAARAKKRRVAARLKMPRVVRHSQREGSKK